MRESDNYPEQRGLPRSKNGDIRFVATREIEVVEDAVRFDAIRQKLEKKHPGVRLVNDADQAVVLVGESVLFAVQILDDGAILIKDPGHQDHVLFKEVVQIMLDALSARN